MHALTCTCVCLRTRWALLVITIVYDPVVATFLAIVLLFQNLFVNGIFYILHGQQGTMVCHHCSHIHQTKAAWGRRIWTVFLYITNHFCYFNHAFFLYEPLLLPLSSTSPPTTSQLTKVRLSTRQIGSLQRSQEEEAQAQEGSGEECAMDVLIYTSVLHHMHTHLLFLGRKRRRGLKVLNEL